MDAGGRVAFTNPESPVGRFRMRKALVSLLVVVGLLVAAGVASAQGHATVAITAHPALGDVLADENGNILYLFTVDERNVSNCSGGCAGFWPPLLTEGDPEAGSGATADLLGTIIRADDTVQVTYNGWPLYYYSQDQDPGDALGQDVNGVWFVLGVNGGPVQTSAVVSTGTHPELGTILVDASGRSMYLFTPDERNVSNCAGVCRDFWPPVLTVDDPQAMGDAAANALGTIASPDGSKMVTYNGWPLYYYKFDERPRAGSDRERRLVGAIGPWRTDIHRYHHRDLGSRRAWKHPDGSEWTNPLPVHARLTESVGLLWWLCAGVAAGPDDRYAAIDGRSRWRAAVDVREGRRRDAGGLQWSATLLPCVRRRARRRKRATRERRVVRAEYVRGRGRDGDRGTGADPTARDAQRRRPGSGPTRTDSLGGLGAADIRRGSAADAQTKPSVALTAPNVQANALLRAAIPRAGGGRFCGCPAPPSFSR